MGSVGTSPASWGSVDLDVAQNQLVGLEVLYLRVCFEVCEQVQDDLDGLLWPSSLGHSELLGLASSTGGTSISSVRDTSLLLEDLGQVFLSSLDVHALQHTGSVVGVLEVSSEVIAAGLNSFVRALLYLCQGLLVLLRIS